jgi:hypothetical protein
MSAKQQLAIPLVLIASLLLPAAKSAADEDKSRSISNWEAVVGTDLGSGIDERITMSLQKGDRASAGTAWLIRQSNERGGGASYKAWKGVYKVYATKDSDILLVRLGFTRAYTGTSARDGITWQSVPRYEPLGIDLEMGIADEAIPNKPTFSVKEAFFVTDEGKKTLKEAEREGLDLIFGRTEYRKPRADMIPIPVGTTWKTAARDSSKESFAVEMPPAFRLRKK